MTTGVPSGQRFIVFDHEKGVYYGVEAFAEYYTPKDFKLTDEQEHSVKTIVEAFRHTNKLEAIRVSDPKIYEATGSHVSPPSASDS